MESRLDRKRLGNEGEALVASYLADAGMEVLARNVRLGYLEIDLVVLDGPVVALVEVRRRSIHSRTTGFTSVDAKKRVLLRRAGERIWNRVFRYRPEVERLRFDVAAIQDDGSTLVLEYAKGAFY